MKRNPADIKKILFSNPVIYVPVIITSIILIILIVVAFRGNETSTESSRNINGSNSISTEPYDDTSVASVRPHAKELNTLGIGANNIKAIKNAIIKTVAENDTILDTDNLDISIRANSIKSRTYSDELGKEFYYVNFIADLPNDKKSYQIVHEWGESDVAENSPYSAMVFCIRDKNKIVYKNFECKDNYKKNPKYEIIAHYLPYEDFNNYDFSISQTSNKKIYIQLPGDQEQAAIKEIKQWIETMGFTSDGFNFEAEDQTAAPPDEPTD